MTRKIAAVPKSALAPVVEMDPRAELVKAIEKHAVKARRGFDCIMAEIAHAPRPVSALEWSTGMFEYAVTLEVMREVHAALTAKDSKATVASVREWALGMVISAAKRTSSSTSVTANLCERLAAPAWAVVYEEADWLAREVKP